MNTLCRLPLFCSCRARQLVELDAIAPPVGWLYVVLAMPAAARDRNHVIEMHFITKWLAANSTLKAMPAQYFHWIYRRAYNVGASTHSVLLQHHLWMAFSPATPNLPDTLSIGVSPQPLPRVHCFALAPLVSRTLGSNGFLVGVAVRSAGVMAAGFTPCFPPICTATIDTETLSA